MTRIKTGDIVIGDGSVKICMPISAGNSAELSEELEYVSGSLCDIAEWRYDYWSEGGLSDIIAIIGGIKEKLGKKPLLFTYRTCSEGGLGSDSPGIYREVNMKAIMSGRADIVDLEFEKGQSVFGGIIRSARQNNVKVMVSKHLYESVSKSRMIGMLRDMQGAGGDIIKLAVNAEDARGAHDVTEAAREVYEKYADAPIVTIGMGTAGVTTRYIKPFYGSSITFVKGVRGTAPGQLSIEELLACGELSNDV